MTEKKQLSLKQKQQIEREKIILNTAEEVLIEQGYYHTNMEEIARRVGIAKGTLYLHFAKKEELVFALVEPKLSAFLQTIEEIKQMGVPSDEKLKRILEKEMAGAFFQFVMKSYPDMAAVFQEERGIKIQTVLQDIVQGISALLDEGKKEGTIDEDIPTELMAHTFMNLFDPHVYKVSVEAGTISKADFIQYTSKMFFKGIQTRKENDE